MNCWCTMATLRLLHRDMPVTLTPLNQISPEVGRSKSGHELHQRGLAGQGGAEQDVEAAVGSSEVGRRGYGYPRRPALTTFQAQASCSVERFPSMPPGMTAIAPGGVEHRRDASGVRSGRTSAARMRRRFGRLKPAPATASSALRSRWSRPGAFRCPAWPSASRPCRARSDASFGSLRRGPQPP